MRRYVYLMFGFAAMCLTVFCLSVSPSRAEIFTVDLAQDSIDITTGFTGARLSLYGVKGAGENVIVTVKGPLKDVLVREKTSVLGVWVNRHSLTIKQVPQFYDYAKLGGDNSETLQQIMAQNAITLEAQVADVEKSDWNAEQITEFQKALIRNKQAAGLFPVEPKDIIYLNDHFFKVEFYVPSNVPTGTYTIETYLIGGDAIIDRNLTTVEVAQVGMAATIYSFAHTYPFGYALSIVLFAVAAGWVSNAVRRSNV